MLPNCFEILSVADASRSNSFDGKFAPKCIVKFTMLGRSWKYIF